MPLVVAGRKSILAASGGAGCFMNADSGCALYPACTFTTFDMSSALKSWVRNTVSEKGVVDWKTFLIPAAVPHLSSRDPLRDNYPVLFRLCGYRYSHSYRCCHLQAAPSSSALLVLQVLKAPWVPCASPAKASNMACRYWE